MNFNLQIPDLDGSSYLPLDAFTKKPIYGEYGPLQDADGDLQRICDPYCQR